MKEDRWEQRKGNHNSKVAQKETTTKTGVGPMMCAKPTESQIIQEYGITKRVTD